MDHTICNQVRFEIDEKDLGTPLSASSIDHLRRCADCQEFQNKETKLRQIVGSLETVNAPADFDFRLRARLANDASLNTFHLASPLRLLRLRSVAVAAIVVIFAGVAFVLWQSNQTQTSNENTVSKDVPKSVDQPQPGSAGSAPAPITAAIKTPPVVSEHGDKQPPLRISTRGSNKRGTSTLEFSNTAAPVIRGEQSIATMRTFPLDVSPQTYKVLLDDDRGSSRTISVPTVSFGSRRVFTSGSLTNQYAPKSDW